MAGVITMSDIRVSVQWKNLTVFAGEDIECTITFKNVALARSVRRSPSPSPHSANYGSHRERWKETLPIRSANSSTSATHRKSPSFSSFSQSHARTHKQGSSISSANGIPKSPIIDVGDDISKTAAPGDNKHRRSVSIVSIRGQANDEIQHGQLKKSGRLGHSHIRSASLHVMPRGNGPLSNGALSGSSHSQYYVMC